GLDTSARTIDGPLEPPDDGKSFAPNRRSLAPFSGPAQPQGKGRFAKAVVFLGKNLVFLSQQHDQKLSRGLAMKTRPIDDFLDDGLLEFIGNCDGANTPVSKIQVGH